MFLFRIRRPLVSKRQTQCTKTFRIHHESGRIYSSVNLVLVRSKLGISGAFHYAKLTGQRSVGMPEENGTTFSD